MTACTSLYHAAARCARSERAHIEVLLHALQLDVANRRPELDGLQDHALCLGLLVDEPRRNGLAGQLAKAKNTLSQHVAGNRQAFVRRVR